MFNPFPNKPWFLRVCSTSLLKTLWEKEKLLVTSNFSFSHSVYYQFGELSAIFINFENGRLQTLSVWKSLKFVVWERVKEYVNTRTDGCTDGRTQDGQGPMTYARWPMASGAKIRKCRLAHFLHCPNVFKMIFFSLCRSRSACTKHAAVSSRELVEPK